MKATELKTRMAEGNDRPERVVVAPGALLEEAVGTMRTYGIHHLLVMEGDRLAGVLEAASALLLAREKRAQARVEEVMQRDVPVIDEGTEVQGALRLMLDHGVSALPIVRGGKAVGILTESDLLRLLDTLLHRRGGLEQWVASGEVLLANPLVQNVLKSLSDAGI